MECSDWKMIDGKTAAGIVLSRVDANQPNMNLTTWKGSVVRKQDFYTAKNYLSDDEIDTLNRLVVIFLESAELRAKNRLDITMNFWLENVDKILEFQDKKVLKNASSISNAEMEARIIEIYGNFDKQRKVFDDLQADQNDMEDLKELEEKIKTKKILIILKFTYNQCFDKPMTWYRTLGNDPS
ncbi:MAG: RhuM family protein [Mariniphaga sp.]